MSDTRLAQDRRALLELELVAMGADVRRLDFLTWLVTHDRDPEWGRRRAPRRRGTRRMRPTAEELPLAA